MPPQVSWEKKPNYTSLGPVIKCVLCWKFFTITTQSNFTPVSFVSQILLTFTVQSSAPLTMYCGPLLEGKQLFTNELWPFNFFILVPVS